jgi:predicted  nucleic acid-binding Zn-ribbon protein
MKIDKTNILLIIITILVAYNIFQGNELKTNVSSYNLKIDSIQNEIDSVVSLNETITQEIVKLDSQINDVGKNIDTTQQNINTIKKQTDEKINNVNGYTFSDLNKFFTDRYSRYDSVTKGTSR